VGPGIDAAHLLDRRPHRLSNAELYECLLTRASAERLRYTGEVVKWEGISDESVSILRRTRFSDEAAALPSTAT
jgi:hypothetical protein